jgi:hypothetical protein
VAIRPTITSSAAPLREASSPGKTENTQEEQKEGGIQHQPTTPQTGQSEGIGVSNHEYSETHEHDPENGEGHGESNDTMHRPHGPGHIQTENHQFGEDIVRPDLIGNNINKGDQQESDETNVNLGTQRPFTETGFQGNNFQQSGDEENKEQLGAKNPQLAETGGHHDQHEG